MMVDDNDDFGESFVEFLRHTDEQPGDNIPGLSTPDVGSEWSGAENQRLEGGNFSLGSFSVVGEDPIQQVASSSQESASSPSHFDIDKHVRLALQSQTVQVPKQVWESGVWSSIFLMSVSQIQSTCLERNLEDLLLRWGIFLMTMWWRPQARRQNGQRVLSKWSDLNLMLLGKSRQMQLFSQVSSCGTW